MKGKDKNKTKIKTIKQLAEDFIESDSVSATAGKFLLVSVAMGGIMFAGAVAPGIFSLLKKRKKIGRKFTKKQVQYAVNNLRRRKMIEVVKDNEGMITVKLTNKGAERIKEFAFETLKIKKPLHWDKKWRILIFDIPTKPKIYNQAREALRRKIKELGFHQLQKSVWVCPYECEDEILLIAELYHVQKYIEIITAEKILHENIVKRKFNL